MGQNLKWGECLDRPWSIDTKMVSLVESVGGREKATDKNIGGRKNRGNRGKQVEESKN